VTIQDDNPPPGIFPVNYYPTVTARAGTVKVAGQELNAFEITRAETGNPNITNKALTANFALSGNAQFNVDYTINPAAVNTTDAPVLCSVTIPGGANFFTFAVTPIYSTISGTHNITATNNTVTLSLLPSLNYDLGSAASQMSASVHFATNCFVSTPQSLNPYQMELPVSINVLRQVAFVGGQNGANTASFDFTPDNSSPWGSPGSGIPVYFEIAGQAIPNIDYTVAITGGNWTNLATGNYLMPSCNGNINTNLIMVVYGMSIPGLQSHSPTVTITAQGISTARDVASIIVETLHAPGKAGNDPIAALQISQPIPLEGVGFVPDTDDDGVIDSTEAKDNTDPLNPYSKWGFPIPDSYSPAFTNVNGVENGWFTRGIVTESSGDSTSDYLKIGLGINPMVPKDLPGVWPAITLSSPTGLKPGSTTYN
jgi:hypothetical protein